MILVFIIRLNSFVQNDLKIEVRTVGALQSHEQVEEFLIQPTGV